MRIFLLLTSRPKTTLLILAAITILLSIGISKLEVKNNFDGELPQDDPVIDGFNQVQDHFDKRSTVMFGIETDNIYNKQTLEKIVEMTKAVHELPHVRKDEIKSLSTVQNLSSEEWGIDTTGFLDDISEDSFMYEQLRSSVENNNTVKDKLVSSDARLTLIIANLEDDFNGAEVYEGAQIIKNRFEGPEIIHITGAPVLVEEVQQGISGDTSRFIPIAILLVFIGFYISFRTLRAVLLPAVMVILSIVWTMGFMGWVGLPLTVVSNALPVIMVAVASSYGIHYMYAYYKHAEVSISGKEAALSGLQEVGRPILITGITSALGSASLLVFDITSLREFGIIGGFGFVFATVICLSLLPVLNVILPLQRNSSISFKKLLNLFTSLSKRVYHNKSIVFSIYVVLLGVMLYWASTIQVGDDYTKFFPSNHKGRIAANTFNDHLMGIRLMDVMIDSKEFGSIKNAEFTSNLRNLQSEIAGLPFVGGTFSYIDIISHMQMIFEEDGKTITDIVESEQISQYLMLFEMSSDPGDLYALVDDDFERAKLQVYIKSSNPSDHKEIYSRIQDLFVENFKDGSAELFLGGDVVNRISLGDYIVKGKIKNILLAIFFVLITCTIVFRSIKHGLLTIIPIISSLIMIFGVMGLVGIRLGISTSLLTAMIVGVGIDFSVHYLNAFNTNRKNSTDSEALDRTTRHTGKAIFFDAVSNIAGFSVLSVSGFLPVQHFGWLLAFSMLLIFLNTMVLYPALFALIKSKSVQPNHILISSPLNYKS
ncbi:MAG: MMPL family transporter [Flavobacteriaceae bacterium]|nr:MMPL family transporter [Bacteroidia bacterium]MBT8289024.1 MMPL family transporter [Bacteroidia bacterium]NNF74686.1 MMPL family transporter [Flavobacteriaceae bacterium]